MIFRSV